jgi:hypothetical protein
MILKCYHQWLKLKFKSFNYKNSPYIFLHFIHYTYYILLYIFLRKYFFSSDKSYRTNYLLHRALKFQSVINVFFQNLIFLDGTVQRTLKVSLITSETSEPLLRPPISVTQIHYTGWPDYGAPKSTKDLLDLHKLMRVVKRRIIQNQGNENT